jgi:hypothetical protein
MWRKKRRAADEDPYEKIFKEINQNFDPKKWKTLMEAEHLEPTAPPEPTVGECQGQPDHIKK